MSVLVFAYPRSFAALGLLGAPVLGALGLSLTAASIFLLASSDVSLGMKLDALFVGAIGIVFAYFVAMALRTWYSVVTRYVLDSAGVEVQFFSSSSSLTWQQLEAAHYRKLVGQLELRFRDFPRMVVLSNVDMNWTRETVHAAVSLVEKKSEVPVVRSLL